MRYLRATFKNYIGFFNGMGLYKVDIDLTKCIHNIVLIQGCNGSGKSTLLFHLNPFPDGSTSFIPDKTAEKDLVLSHEGDIYTIQIISPADLKGRKTTKAFIQKNGIELNENGNISSYKDIIFSEFELDSNYISLSRLSSTDRGLGDKTPAERKRFTSNIIDNLEIYNSMYKTLNKKSLIYKSHIGTLHTKIQNIGDKATLEQRLSSLKNREAELNTRIMSLNNQIVAIQAKNSIDDEEAKKIQDATTRVEALKSQLDTIQVSIETCYNRTKIKPDNIVDKYTKDNELYTSYSHEYDELSKTWKNKCDRLNTVSMDIVSIEADISNTATDDTIYEKYTRSCKLVSEYRSELKKLNIPDDISLILPLTNLISFCDKIVSLIDSFNDNMTPSDIEFLINRYSKSYIESLMDNQRKTIDKIDKTKLRLADIQGQVKVLSTLESRPKNCKIDTCPFISDAVTLKKNLKIDLVEELAVCQEDILKFSDTVTEIQKEIDYANSLSSKKTILDIIRSTILENKQYIDLFYPDFISTFDSNLINMSTFGEIRDHSRLTDGLNLLKLLDDESRNNAILESEYNGYRDKIKLLNSSKVMLEKLKSEQEELIKTTKDMKVQIDSYLKTITGLKESIDIEKQYYDSYCSFKEIEVKYNLAKSIIDEFQAKSAKALEALSSISEYKSQIDSLSTELNPISRDISTISGQLTLLESYYSEYNEYKSSYDTVEILKKYCSPTGGGIQTIFMQIYMSKTKQTANEVLGMLFGGAYQLLDFVINENEFRIPFIGEGLPVDDISSGSSSQIAMMSMIINLVLLHQASTEFNIAELDEVDGALDSYNRSNFINILFHSINILNIEQLFLISHSLEADNTFADIIKLKSNDTYASINGNVIWDFEEECRKQ